MAHVKYEYTELIILRMIELSSLMPHYWSEFFVMAKQLLNPEEEGKLLKYIRDVERFVLEDEYLFNIFKCKDCGHVWKTEEDWYEMEFCSKCHKANIVLLQERHSLYDIEMAIESNRDYTAYFERYGNKVTKFDVERKLNKIKEWLFSIIKERAMQRRFKRFR